MSAVIGARVCRTCAVSKTGDAFRSFTKGGRTYLRRDCKNCESALGMARRDPIKIAAYQKKWVAEHPDYWRNWYSANRETAIGYVHQRRARKKNNGTYRITEQDWQRVIDRFGGLCAYCKTAPWTHRDHVIPLIRGGSHGIGNLLPACQPCNQSKGSKLLIEWRSRVPA